MQEIAGFPSFRRKMQMQDPLEFPFPYITQYIYNWMDKRPENFTPPAKPRHRTCAGGSVPQGSPAHHWQVMIGTAVGPRLLAPGTAAQRNLRGRGVDSSTWIQYGKKHGTLKSRKLRHAHVALLCQCGSWAHSILHIACCCMNGGWAAHDEAMPEETRQAAFTVQVLRY